MNEKHGKEAWAKVPIADDYEVKKKHKDKGNDKTVKAATVAAAAVDRLTASACADARLTASASADASASAAASGPPIAPVPDKGKGGKGKGKGKYKGKNKGKGNGAETIPNVKSERRKPGV